MHLKVGPGRVKRGYSSLDELHRDRDEIPWYWRVAALFASWMILGGYLILPSTFDSDPHLRFSKGGLVAIIVVLLVLGYALTAVLYRLVHNSLFHSENLFYPCLCSSALGLLGVLYAFISSSRYKLDSAAGAGIALTSSSTAIFAVLMVFTQRKLSRIREGAAYQAAISHHREVSVGEMAPETPFDSRDTQHGGNLFPSNNDAAYYRNYLVNMHPTAVRATSLHTRDSLQSLRQAHSPSPPLHPPLNPFQDPSTNAPSPHIRFRTHSVDALTSYPESVHTAGSVHNAPTPNIIPGSPGVELTEADMVNQQMARLLLQTGERGSSSEGPSQTFHIDWPTEDDPDSPSAQIKLPARSGSGSRLVPPGRILEAQAPPPSQHKKKDSRTGLLARISPFHSVDRSKGDDGDADRGRSDAARAGRSVSGPEQPRGKSRDERRREIELGAIGAAMDGKQVPRSGDPARFSR